MVDTERQTGGTGRTVGLAILMMLMANLLFSMVDTSTKWLLGAGYVALQLAFMRYAIHLILCGFDVALRGKASISGLRSNFKLLLIRAICLVSTSIVVFIALKFLSLTVASAMMFTAPIIVCALSGPLLGERVGWVRFGLIVLGFCGVLVIVQPFSDNINLTALVMLIPATGLALYSIMTRKLAANVNPVAMQLVLGLTGTIVLAPIAYMNWIAPASATDLALMVGLGVFAWSGHELLIRAHQITDASLLMPFSYSYLIYMMTSGFFIFGDIPNAATLAGALMIAASGFGIWGRERRIASSATVGKV